MSRMVQFLAGVLMLFAVLVEASKICTPSTVKADLNGNGRLDLAVADGKQGAVSVFLSAPDGSLILQGRYALSRFPEVILATDLNGNGALDLATANAPDGTVSVLLNYGDGTFGPPSTYQTNLLAPFSIATHDANADGNVD